MVMLTDIVFFCGLELDRGSGVAELAGNGKLVSRCLQSRIIIISHLPLNRLITLVIFGFGVRM